MAVTDPNLSVAAASGLGTTTANAAQSTEAPFSQITQGSNGSVAAPNALGSGLIGAAVVGGLLGDPLGGFALGGLMSGMSPTNPAAAGITPSPLSQQQINSLGVPGVSVGTGKNQLFSSGGASPISGFSENLEGGGTAQFGMPDFLSSTNNQWTQLMSNAIKGYGTNVTNANTAVTAAGNAALSTLSPYVGASRLATTALTGLTGLASSDPAAMNALLAATPGYQFQLQQGEQAIQASQAAKGMLGSGNTLTALNNYAQGQAQNVYQSSINNLMNIATLNPTSAEAAAQLQYNTGVQQSSNLMTGAANALNSAFTQAGDYFNMDAQISSENFGLAMAFQQENASSYVTAEQGGIASALSSQNAQQAQTGFLSALGAGGGGVDYSGGGQSAQSMVDNLMNNAYSSAAGSVGDYSGEGSGGFGF